MSASTTEAERRTESELDEADVYCFTLAGMDIKGVVGPDKELESGLPDEQVIRDNIELEPHLRPVEHQAGSATESALNTPERLNTVIAVAISNTTVMERNSPPNSPLTKRSSNDKRLEMRTISLLLKAVVQEIEERGYSEKGWNPPVDPEPVKTEEVTITTIITPVDSLTGVGSVRTVRDKTSDADQTPCHPPQEASAAVGVLAGGEQISPLSRTFSGSLPERTDPKLSSTPSASSVGNDPLVSEPLSLPLPPHLRNLDPMAAMLIMKRKAASVLVAAPIISTPTPPAVRIENTSAASSNPSSTAARKPNNRSFAPLAGLKEATTGFRLPANPHIGGYDIHTVLKDVSADSRVDVRGLRFTAWPKPVNRGDTPIQEPRAVIIDVPPKPTLSRVSLICKGAGRLESIVIDEVKSKALVTFIEATAAHEFWKAALRPLELRVSGEGEKMTKQKLIVRMDYPVDQIPYKVYERLHSEGASRVVCFGGWEKKNLVKLVGEESGINEDLDVLLMRFAGYIVPGSAGGKIESVAWKDQGWEFFEGSLVYAGIQEGMTAFDNLKVEGEFKGCDIKFGKDP